MEFMTKSNLVNFSAPLQFSPKIGDPLFSCQFLIVPSTTSNIGPKI